MNDTVIMTANEHICLKHVDDDFIKRHKFQIISHICIFANILATMTIGSCTRVSKEIVCYSVIAHYLQHETKCLVWK
jgi:hypothetical protein